MKINQIFCDGMVLQANAPIRVFGEGSGLAYIEIDGVSKETISDGENWLVELPPHNYGGPFVMKAVLAGKEQIISDVYFGDVFLLAGQSNLQMKLHETNTPKEEYKSNKLLRLFTLQRLEEGEYFFPEDGWVVAEEKSVCKWSAIGYLSGNIHSCQTGHAVGIIACYQGASVIQSWLPEGILSGTECDIATEQASGHMRVKEYMLWNHDGQLYREMFLKLVPFSVKAVIWYQGESNSDPPENTVEVYRGMLKRLIEKWREALRNPGLSFIVIQLPDLLGVSHPDGWKAVQQAQAEISGVTENVYTVVCRDICENDNIHPPTKLPLSQRIANILKNLHC